MEVGADLTATTNGGYSLATWVTQENFCGGDSERYEGQCLNEKPLNQKVQNVSRY